MNITITIFPHINHIVCHANAMTVALGAVSKQILCCSNYLHKDRLRDYVFRAASTMVLVCLIQEWFVCVCVCFMLTLIVTEYPFLPADPFKIDTRLCCYRRCSRNKKAYLTYTLHFGTLPSGSTSGACSFFSTDHIFR